ncbi:MAG: NUDIX hydrolase N-terminal domain-containing protein [Pricia sp.]
MQQNRQLDLIKRIKALADTGLVYAKDDYDTERYEELRKISMELLGQVSNHPIAILHEFFLPEKDYPTVKVDVRGLVSEDRILKSQLEQLFVMAKDESSTVHFD